MGGICSSTGIEWDFARHWYRGRVPSTPPEPPPGGPSPLSGEGGSQDVAQLFQGPCLKLADPVFRQADLAADGLECLACFFEVALANDEFLTRR